MNTRGVATVKTCPLWIAVVGSLLIGALGGSCGTWWGMRPSTPKPVVIEGPDGSKIILPAGDVPGKASDDATELARKIAGHRFFKKKPTVGEVLTLAGQVTEL